VRLSAKKYMTAEMKAMCDNVKGLRPIGKFLGD
jgi:hypothetical protein